MYSKNSNHPTEKKDIFQNKKLLEAIKQLKNGNEQGFVTIYEYTYKYVYARARSIFNDEQEVQDLVQEVYVAVYRNIHSLKSDESLFAWLRTITFQQGTKLMRKNGKELLLSEENEEMFDSILDEDAEVENELVDKADVEAIRECINRLSSEHKSVILAYYYDNLKVEEIAELFEISVGTVKSRLHSARKKLKTYIEEEEKKQGYKLHSFGGITFVLVMEAMLQENMELSERTRDMDFSLICEKLGIKCMPTKSISVMNEAEGKTMKSIFTKLAELGTKKVIAIAVGTVVVTGTVGVTGAVLVDKGILFHTHEYVDEITTEPTCEVDGVKTFTCECGDSYTEVIAAVGHSYENYVSNEDATYLADGTETATCVCGLTDTRVAEGSKLEYTFEEQEQTLYAKGNISVRSMPSEDGEEIGSLSEWDEVSVTGQCNETSWYRIAFEDSVGYVSDDSIGERYVYHNGMDGGYSFEPQEIELSPNQQAVINAGYYNVIALPSGAYGVLVHMDEGVNGVGDQLIDNYLAGMGLMNGGFFGGGIEGYSDHYLLATYAEPYVDMTSDEYILSLLP